MSPTARLEPPSASAKTARNISVVATGASTVWVMTFKKRRTSFT